MTSLLTCTSIDHFLVWASGPEGRGEMNKHANRDTRKGVTFVETKY